MSVFQQVAQEGKLTLGLVFPIESYEGSVPMMQDQEVLAQTRRRTRIQSFVVSRCSFFTIQLSAMSGKSTIRGSI